MTNEQYIKSLSRRQLAERLIKIVEEPDYDEGIDGEWCEIGTSTFYVTSDGQEYWDDIDGAIQHECWWLAQEHCI